MFLMPTEPTALIAGANGRLGRVLASWFARRGWRVRALVRSAERGDLPAGVEVFQGDARNHADLIRAGRGADVIVNAVNVPYTQWDPVQLEIADAMALWYIAGQAFSWYLASFADYARIYAGLAGIVAAMIFFYLASVILLYAGALNRALADARAGRKAKAGEDGGG